MFYFFSIILCQYYLRFRRQKIKTNYYLVVYVIAFYNAPLCYYTNWTFLFLYNLY